VRWRGRLSREDGDRAERAASMRLANPQFIPRNHRVEEAIADAEVGRFGKFHQIVQVLARPYDTQPEMSAYAKPPEPEEEVLQTFCGT
jgi:serine/tyrosine/threonine adenylyltransferase